MVVSADAQKLADAILDDFSGLGLLGLVATKPLGDLTERVTTSTSGMMGMLAARFDQDQRSQAVRYGSGSTASPPSNQAPRQISKWRWGPDEPPVPPTSPMR